MGIKHVAIDAGGPGFDSLDGQIGNSVIDGLKVFQMGRERAPVSGYTTARYSNNTVLFQPGKKPS